MLYLKPGGKSVLEERCFHPWMNSTGILLILLRNTPKRYREDAHEKDYKKNNSKHRTKTGCLSATQHASDEDEALAKSIKMATACAHPNSKRKSWQDPGEILNIDETYYAISDLDK